MKEIKNAFISVKRNCLHMFLKEFLSFHNTCFCTVLYVYSFIGVRPLLHLQSFIHFYGQFRCTISPGKLFINKLIDLLIDIANIVLNCLLVLYRIWEYRAASDTPHRV